jgi:serine phosphatase RsbU (regulator of sigma subunit)
VFDEEGVFQGYRGVGSDVSEIKQKERQLAEANRNFGDSISYASSIQLGLLPSPESLGRHLGKTRTIWQPKDLVGGDFYWVGRIGNIDYLVFFDCTGHGVPGAFMTLIVTSVLEAVAVAAPAPPPAARVLQLVHDGVCRQLRIDADTPGHDGLDCAVIRLNRGDGSLEFAGASIDLFEIAADGAVTRHRGARTTLGYRLHDAALPLTSVTLHTGEHAYVMTTDGLLTQIGEGTRRVMGTRRFEEGLATVGGNDPALLVRMAGRILKNWQGREERRDDVAVIAFRPNDFS